MIIPVKTATEALALKCQLTDAGLIIDQDYSWQYTPPKDYYEDPYNYAGMLLGQVEFKFTDPANESFYALKWM